MKRVVVEVEETVKYRRTIHMSIPEHVTEEEFDKLLTKVERSMEPLSASEVPIVISNHFPGSMEYKGNSLDDFSSPSSTALEIESVDFDI